MRFLLVVKQQRNVDAFIEALRLLAGRGHSVTLAVQDADDRRNDRLSSAIDAAGIAVVRCPAVRTDTWKDVATLLRRLRDCLQYLRPEMRQAVKLRARAFDRLRQDLMFDAETHTAVAGLLAIPSEQTRRLDAALALAEQALPTVSQHADTAMRNVLDAELAQQAHGLVDEVAARPDRTKP